MATFQISSLTPFKPEWFHAFMIHPFSEGTARINRAFNGVDFLTLIPRSLSLKERAVDLITGVLLLLPLVNTVLWIAMQTWGHPDYLADPYIESEQEPAIPPPPAPIAIRIEPNIPIVQAIAPRLEVQPPPIEQPIAEVLQPVAPVTNQAQPLHTVEHTYEDRKGTSVEHSQWKIEEFPDLTIATKQSSTEVAIARYNQNGEIQEYHFNYKDPNRGELHIKMEDRHLHIKGRGQDGWREKSIRMAQNYPWIQQMTLGIKNFVLANQNKLDFYILNPKELDLSHGVLEKKGLETVPGLGQLMKIEARPGGFLLGFRKVATIWADPQSGLLKKMSWQLLPWDEVTTTEWRQNGP